MPTSIVPRTWPQSILRGASPVWLLSIELGGHIYRWSTRPIDAGGYPWTGGLDDLEVQIEADEGLSASLSVPWSGLIEAIRDGYDVAAAVGELSIWIPGEDYDTRRRMIRGIISGPSYAEEGRRVSLSLAQHDYDDRALVPSPDATTDDGEVYPVCLGESTRYPVAPIVPRETRQCWLLRWTPDPSGTPGPPAPGDIMNHTTTPSPHPQGEVIWGGGDDSGWVVILQAYDITTDADLELWAVGDELTHTGVPGTIEEWSALGGYLRQGVVSQGAIGATSTRIYGRQLPWTTPLWGTSTSLAAAITSTADADGRPLAVVDRAPEAGGETVIWSAESPLLHSLPVGTSGVRAPMSARSAGGAGDLALWLLSRSSVAYDVGAWRGAQGYLDRWRLSGYLDDPAAPMEVLRDVVGRLCPVSIGVGPEGVYPIVWRWDATEADAVDRIERGPTVTPQGDVRPRIAPERVVNRLSIRYRWDGRDRYQTYRGTLDMGGAAHSAVTRRSQLRYGVRQAETLETRWVHDGGTAARVADWRLLRDAATHRVASYRVPLDRAWYRLGDVVIIHDPERGIDEALALVSALTAGPAPRLTAGLVILDTPATWTQATGPEPDDGPTGGGGTRAYGGGAT